MGYKNDDPCIKKAYPDERLFVLMARDPAAAKVVLYWIVRSFETQPTEKLREAFECAIEMRDNVKKFYDRKEEDKKKKIAAQERDEFDRWKKMKDGKGPLTPFPGNNEVGNYAEAPRNLPSGNEINFACNFANWIDAQDHDSKEELISSPHGFAKFLDKFIKSLPNR